MRQGDGCSRTSQGRGGESGAHRSLIIVPILNEAPTLEELAERLMGTLHSIGKSYEVTFVDDGSTDTSAKLLKGLYELHPTIKVIRLNRNYGQHQAIFAGLERA
jgi:glycosyltransferase involved in cell wall biosynthesis